MLLKIYNSLIRNRKDAVSFIILLFFLLAFGTSRTYIYLNTAGIIPDTWFINRNIRGVHIHHLAFGIIILTISGYLSLNFHGKRFGHFNAALYGIGLGLAYDEFGMWLLLEDNYWIRQSYDAVAVISIILINAVYFSRLWQRILIKFISLSLRLINSRLLKAQRLPLLRRGKAK